MFFLFFPQQLKKINIWNWFNCPIVLLSHLPLATWVSSLIVIRTPGLISNYHIVIFDSNQYSNACTPGLHSPGVQALVSRILEDKHGVLGLGLEGSGLGLGLGLEILALTTSLIVISVFPYTSSVFKSCFYHIRDLKRIKHSRSTRTFIISSLSHLIALPISLVLKSETNYSIISDWVAEGVVG